MENRDTTQQDVKAPAGRRWALILAGGEGERMRSFIESRMGAHRPKQYCAFTGSRTLLEHTVDRAQMTVGDRIVTVIGKGHGRYLSEPHRIPLPGKVVEQPANLDTAPGVLLGLAHITAMDPEATVVLFPSDHFVAPKVAFRERVETAFRVAEETPGGVLLLGAEADRPDTDYGWIETGEAGPDGALRVSGFREKPDAATAAALHERGALWNTLVTAAKARALWDLAEAACPALAFRFKLLAAALGTPLEKHVLAAAYRKLPRANFSKDLLEQAGGRLKALPMTGVDWCDWGRPERVMETLRRSAEPRTFGLERVPAPVLAAGAVASLVGDGRLPEAFAA